jgi:hypothetical protein
MADDTIKKNEADDRGNPDMGYQGIRISPEEIDIIAGLYTSCPRFAGIYAYVERAYRKVAQKNKHIRTQITRPSIKKIADQLGLEEIRQNGRIKLRERYIKIQDKLLDDHITLVNEVLRVISEQLLGQIPPDANYADFDRIMRLRYFVNGEPDSRPDGAGNSVNIYQMTGALDVDDGDLDAEIAKCDQALDAGVKAPENRL